MAQWACEPSGERDGCPFKLLREPWHVNTAQAIDLAVDFTKNIPSSSEENGFTTISQHVHMTIITTVWLSVFQVMDVRVAYPKCSATGRPLQSPLERQGFCVPDP